MTIRLQGPPLSGGTDIPVGDEPQARICPVDTMPCPHTIPDRQRIMH
jgi:hypothetical protein